MANICGFRKLCRLASGEMAEAFCKVFFVIEVRGLDDQAVRSAAAFEQVVRAPSVPDVDQLDALSWRAKHIVWVDFFAIRELHLVSIYKLTSDWTGRDAQRLRSLRKERPASFFFEDKTKAARSSVGHWESGDAQAVFFDERPWF